MAEVQTTSYTFMRVLPHDEPGGKCPACSKPLDVLDAAASDDTTWFCSNDKCPFYLSGAVAAVVEGLLQQGMSIHQACEIAAAFTLEDDSPEPVERFAVRDRPSAEWVMRKLAEVEAEIEEISDSIEMEVARAAVRIRTRGEAILKPLRRRHQFFTLAYSTQLRDWAKSQLKGKERSVKLIHGTVKFKKISERVAVTNPEDALKWAKDRDLDDLIKSTESFKTKEFLERFSDQVATDPIIKTFAEIIPASEKVTIEAALPGGES